MSNDGNGVDPWAVVAHKDGFWYGASAAEMSDIGRWMGKWIKRGLTITTVHSRAEFNELMGTLKQWEPPAPKQRRLL